MIQDHDLSKIPSDIVGSLKNTLMEKIRFIFKIRPSMVMDKEDVCIYLWEDYRIKPKPSTVTDRMVVLCREGHILRVGVGEYMLNLNYKQKRYSREALCKSQ